MADDKKTPVAPDKPLDFNFPDVDFIDLPDGYSMVATLRFKFGNKNGGKFSFNQVMEEFDAYMQTARQYMIKKFAGKFGVSVNFEE